MDLFKQLETSAREQNSAGELPDFLLEPLLSVANSADKFQDQRKTVELLLRQVENFDAYAGAGCFGDSYGPQDILRTLMQLSITPE